MFSCSGLTDTATAVTPAGTLLMVTLSSIITLRTIAKVSLFSSP